MPIYETQNNCSWANQANIIKEVLNDWSATLGGVCIVAGERDQQLLTGYNSCIGPKMKVVFISEEFIGDDSTKETVCWTRRYFDIMIERGGKDLTDPLSSTLSNINGPAEPFYDLVEDCRDTIRTILWPVNTSMALSEYHGTRPAYTENWLMDSFVISIAVITQVPKVLNDPQQLTYELNSPIGGPTLPIPNQPPEGY